MINDTFPYTTRQANPFTDTSAEQARQQALEAGVTRIVFQNTYYCDQNDVDWVEAYDKDGNQLTWRDHGYIDAVQLAKRLWGFTHGEYEVDLVEGNVAFIRTAYSREEEDRYNDE